MLTKLEKPIQYEKGSRAEDQRAHDGLVVVLILGHASL